VTQCVTIREGAIEKPHVPQIRRVEASPKFGSQPLRQPGQEFCAVLRPVRASLLELDYVPSNFPASADLHHVHSPKGVLPGFLNQSAQPPQQSVESHRRALNILLCGSFFPHKLLTLLRPVPLENFPRVRTVDS
jgi:hypothetical protein